MNTSPSLVAIGLAAAIVTNAIAIARADIRITSDPGGSLRQYQIKVEDVRRSGEKVIIDGQCNSACTLWLTLPRSQVCVTSRAVFGFHSAINELGLSDWRVNEQLTSSYPRNVQVEIGKRGGLWFDKTIYIRGTSIAARCK